MGDTKLADYPARLGDKQLIVVDHTGPVSYTAGGETLGTANNLTGIALQGLSGLDLVIGGGSMSLSGNYHVRPQQTGTGNRKQQKLLWYPAGTSVTQGGIPLSLGTASAAATQSTFTSAGLLTVVGANSLKAGNFVVLSNGTSGAGLPFNGVIVGIVSATASSYTAYFGQGSALNYTIATDTLKYQLVQAAAGNPLQAIALASPITGVLATANLLTITQANNLSVGQFVYLNGPFKTASVYALGAIVQVASASSTGWTANWQGTVIAQTSGEVATASLLVTNGTVPITSYPYAAAPAPNITNSLAVAATGTTAGLLTLTAANVYQPGMLIVVQNIGANTQLNGTIATVITTGLTQAIIKANGWGVVASTSAETEGFAALLITGGNPYGAGDVAPGTNLSGETVRLGYIGR
jgi:hypothetical protein